MYPYKKYTMKTHASSTTYVVTTDASVCSFGLRLVHRLEQRGSRVLFNTFIKGHARKKQNKEGHKEKVKERASTSQSSA